MHMNSFMIDKIAKRDKMVSLAWHDREVGPDKICGKQGRLRMRMEKC